jgi:hypothetical protein
MSKGYYPVLIKNVNMSTLWLQDMVKSYQIRIWGKAI